MISQIDSSLSSPVFRRALLPAPLALSIRLCQTPLTRLQSRSKRGYTAFTAVTALGSGTGRRTLEDIAKANILFSDGHQNAHSVRRCALSYAWSFLARSFFARTYASYGFMIRELPCHMNIILTRMEHPLCIRITYSSCLS